MKTEITLMDTVNICNGCDGKIKKGKSAINVVGKEIYFCNENCLIKRFKKSED